MLQAAPQTIQPPDDDGIHLPALGVCDQAVQGGTAILRARHPFVDELHGGPAACGHVFPFNDRLLLGLKGTMSEAELHVLRARLIGGQLNKARRGELWMRPPLGCVVDPRGTLMLDPDEHVHGAIRLLFETFRQTGSSGAVVRDFREQGVAWPQRVVTGLRAGTLVFGALGHHRVLGILHNPRYAGAYVYGRTRQRKVVLAGQSRHRRLPREDWKVFLSKAHPGYITWEQFEANQATLRESAHGVGWDRRRSAPREGAWRCCKGSSSAVGAATA